MFQQKTVDVMKKRTATILEVENEPRKEGLKMETVNSSETLIEYIKLHSAASEKIIFFIAILVRTSDRTS